MLQKFTDKGVTGHKCDPELFKKFLLVENKKREILLQREAERILEKEEKTNKNKNKNKNRNKNRNKNKNEKKEERKRKGITKKTH